MIIRKKIALFTCFCVAFSSVVIAVKPPGYVEPPKVEEKNPPKYAYNYAITGEDKGVQGHHEVRNGINTTGNYFVKTGDAQSDVSYFSDDWGFHPVARYELKSENSHVSSHFALGKEAVDALNDNKDGRFPVPQESDKSAPLKPAPRPVFAPTKLPVVHQQPHFVQVSPQPIQFVTPSRPLESELNQPHNAPHFQPAQNLQYDIVQPNHQLHFIQPLPQQQQQPHPQEIPTNGHQQPNFDITYAQQPQKAFVTVNIQHGLQKPQDLTFVSTTPQYVSNQDVFDINAAANPQPRERPNTNEHEKSPGGPSEPQNINSIAFQHPIVVGDIEFNSPAPAVSKIQENREYLPPVQNANQKVNLDLIKIDHNQGQFLKEVTSNLDISHQYLEGDQHMIDSTSAPKKEAPSRYFLKQYKNRPAVVSTTPVYTKTETLVITQRPISNKFLAPVQAGLKLANDDCNDEEEHQRHTQVTKTIVEVQKSVNVNYDSRKQQYGARYLPPKKCNGFGSDCNTQVVVQPHIIKEQIPVHFETQKIIEKPVPYPVNHIIEKQVPVYKETVKEVKVPIYVPKPYPVKEIQEVQKIVHVDRPVEKIVHVDRPVEKIVHVDRPVVREKIVDRPYPVVQKEIVHVDRPVVHEKIVHVDRPVIKEKTVVKEVPVVKEVQKIVHVDRPVEKIVHVDRPVVHEKFVDRPYPVVQKEIVHVDRPVPYPVEKIVEKKVEKIVDRPYAVVKEKIVHVDRPVEVPVQKIVHVDRPVEKIVHVDRPYPVEKIIDRPYPVEKIVDRPYPVEKIVDRPYPVEKIVNRPYPVEKIVKEVVEKVVHVDRPYPVHVPVEKIVDRPYPVEKVVEKVINRPYPVEKIVDRPYPVEKIVKVPFEKVVHVDRPYPVEKVVHVDRPYPVHVPVEKIVDRPYPVEKIIDRPYPVEKIVKVPVEKLVEKVVHVDRPYPVHVPVEKIVDRPYPVEKIVDRPYPVEKIVKIPVEKIVEKVVHVDRPYPVEKIIDRPYPVEKIVKVPVEKIVEKVVHVDRPYPVHVPVEKIVDRPYPVEKIVDRPYPVEKIVEKVVHVDRPVPYEVKVPVEKIVHVDRPVPYEVKVPVEKIVDRPYPVEKIVDRPYPVEKIVEKVVHVDRPYPVHVPVDRPVQIPVHIPVEKVVHVPVDRPVHIPVDRPVQVPVYIPQPYKVPVHHEKPQLFLKPVHKPHKSLFTTQHKIKHVFLDHSFPMPPPHSHYSYPSHKSISVEKPKFTGYHYEKPSVPFNVDHHKAVYADKFSHPQPCLHASHPVRDEYVGPTPFTSDYWATGTRDGITVKRHIENGRSLRIESGGFLPPLEPSTPIDANGVPLKNEESKK